MGENRRRILITGTTGLVGSCLYTTFKSIPDWDVCGTSRSPGKFVDYQTDLTDPDTVQELASEIPSDIVIHTAAISKTDVCESDKKKCYAANVESTQNLIAAYPRAKFIFFSTYAVYNTREGKCNESASVNATNYYIETKLLGENLVTPLLYPIIFRPSVIFGHTDFERESMNYFMQLVENIRNKKVTQSPIDQYFNPIHVNMVTEIVKRSITGNISGIYNIGSNEDISKYDFNRLVMHKFHFNESYLKGVNSQILKTIRPMNGTISSIRIQQILDYKIPSLDEMIDILFQSTAGNNLLPGISYG